MSEWLKFLYNNYNQCLKDMRNCPLAKEEDYQSIRDRANNIKAQIIEWEMKHPEERLVDIDNTKFIRYSE